jgi:hypothetical protein
MFEGDVFEPKMDVKIGGWKKLHNEELHNMYSLRNNILIIESNRMARTGHAARMREKTN